MGNSSNFDEGQPKLSEEEKKAGNQMFLSVAAIILLTGIIFFTGQFFRAWHEERSIAMDEMHINSQYIIAQGDVQRVIPAAGAVYFTTENDTGYFMPRILPSWKPAGPQPSGSKKEILLGADSQGQRLLIQKNKKYYLKDTGTGKMTLLAEPETHPDFIRADFCADGKKLVAETQTPASELWQWDFENLEWKKIAQGHHADYSHNGKWLYYERQGTIFGFDLENEEEQSITKGYLPSISDKGHYLAYVQEKEGIEEIFLCRVEEPENVFQLSRHKELGGKEQKNARYTDLSWEYQNTALYAARNIPKADAEVKYYTLSNVKSNVDEQASIWLEGAVMGDTEAVKTIFSQDLYAEDVQKLEKYGLGVYAQEKANGLEGSGMYQKMGFQLFYPEKHGGIYEDIRGKLYFHPAEDGFQLENYISREQNKYQIRGDKIYYQHENEPAVLLHENTFKGALWCSYNSGHDDVMVIQKPGKEYKISVIDEENNLLEVPLKTAETARLYQAGFSGKGHVASLFYRDSKTKNTGIYILNLKENIQIPSEFLNDIEKAYWKNEELIVYSGSKDLSVRWVYAPSEGTLRLHD